MEKQIIWEMIKISKFYSNIANIGSEDNVNMAGTDTVCNIGVTEGTMLLRLVQLIYICSQQLQWNLVQNIEYNS